MTVRISEIINNKYDMQREMRLSKKNKRERKMAAARMNEYRQIEDRKRRMAEILKAREGLCQLILGKTKGTYENCMCQIYSMLFYYKLSVFVKGVDMNIHKQQELFEKIRTLNVEQLNYLLANPCRDDKDWADKHLLMEIERDSQMKSLHCIRRRVYE